MAGLLITGASGYLGGELARRAPAAGTYLSGNAPPELELAIRLDLRDADAVATVLRKARPEVVIHTAYLQGGADAEAVNVGGSRAVARGAAEGGARLLHISTDLVFDGALGRPYRPGDEPNPVMEYGAQKLRAEQAVRAEHPEALVVRTSLIYGGPTPSPHEQLALAAASGEKQVSFFTDELRSPVQVRDLAGALIELAEGGRTGTVHVAGADGVSRYEFARLVVGKAGGDASLLKPGLAAEHPDPRPLDCRLESDPVLRGVREVLG